MPQIYFHNETGKKAFEVKNKRFLKNWIKNVLKSFNKHLEEDLSYVFVSEKEIIKLNKESLGHDYPTDIITFQYNSEKIGGDVFLCPEVISQNAKNYETDYKNELHRVLIHAVLHLLGYGDKTSNEQAEMRLLEDRCLNLRPTEVSRGTIL